jgi:DNA-binding response OmpR family regulator
MQKKVAEEINIGDLRIYLDGRLPECAGKMLELTRREQRILEYLARNRTRYVSKAQIFNAVYGLFEYQTDERTIESHICKLRKKLVEYLGFDPIQTRRYLGYMLSEAQTLAAENASDRSRPTCHVDMGVDPCAA